MEIARGGLALDDTKQREVVGVVQNRDGDGAALRGVPQQREVDARHAGQHGLLVAVDDDRPPEDVGQHKAVHVAKVPAGVAAHCDLHAPLLLPVLAPEALVCKLLVKPLLNAAARTRARHCVLDGTPELLITVIDTPHAEGAGIGKAVPVAECVEDVLPAAVQAGVYYACGLRLRLGCRVHEAVEDQRPQFPGVALEAGQHQLPRALVEVPQPTGRHLQVPRPVPSDFFRLLWVGG
mmetsp:Transcript_35204/g.99663  ORF Transcript_35204/g.99663 Transcript_35204/m.99663 type:complete len:236 (+) Transcript_35204:221-928(+)